jgi:hypothetical protein
MRDSIIYDRARRACKEASEDLNLGSFDIERETVARKLFESAPIRAAKATGYTSQMVKDLVDAELVKVDARSSSKPDWKKKCTSLGYVVAGVATKLKPTIDLLMPQGFEYTLPYGCLMLIFTVGMLMRLTCQRLVYLNRDRSREGTKKTWLSKS